MDRICTASARIASISLFECRAKNPGRILASAFILYLSFLFAAAFALPLFAVIDRLA
jgi:hypothetical protein